MSSQNTQPMQIDYHADDHANTMKDMTMQMTMIMQTHNP
jgi:hypothetical protein